MDISSLMTASPVFSGYSNFLNNLGSALGTNLITHQFQKKMAERQYKYQLALQQQAQQHQIHMYKHQHQWRVDDLRSAGLNPILATHAGSSMPSASVGSVGLGSPSTGSSSALNVDSLARIFNNRYKKENELLDAQISSAKAKADSDKALAGVNLNLAKKYASESSTEDAKRNFEYSPEVIRLKKRLMKYNSTGRIGKEFGLVDEVLFPDENSAFDGFVKEHERKKYENKQFWNIFKKDLRKSYKKSFPFLFK